MGTARSSTHVDVEILDGAPCFAGTRVPVRTLLDYLRAGDRIDDFLADFPTVSRVQVDALLRAADEAVDRDARSAG